MISIISFLIVISICVISHEGGHYLAARWRDVMIHEFSFGMGPAIWSRKKGETLWSFRALPIGGFVKLEGEDASDEDAPKPEGYKKERALNHKKAWERLIIIAAGATVNLILAWLLTASYLTGYGVYNFDKPEIGVIMPQTAAEKAGLQTGDIIKSINGKHLSKWSDIRENLQDKNTKSDQFTIVIERGGADKTIETTIAYDSTHKGRLLGVQPSQVKYPIHQALAQGFGYSWKMGMEILKGMWMVITGQVKSEVVGPVGIAVMAGDAFKQGFWSFIAFMGIINLHLGLLNLLPFPALDGGRIIFITIEILTGKKVPDKYESMVHYAGFVILISLIILITGKDILKLFN